MNPKVEEYIAKLTTWQKEIDALRTILLDCLLTEELKWGVPCYTFQGKNIALLGGFKYYCALSFVKGVLLLDAEGLLESPGKNSQSVRLFKFSSTLEIIKLEPIIKRYIFEAIEVEKAGLKVEKKDDTALLFPVELHAKFNEHANFKKAFEALTPGRQRAYNMYFSDAKQSKTREQRIEGSINRILCGKGFNDCTCGLSKRMPNCDGSHKTILGFKRL